MADSALIELSYAPQAAFGTIPTGVPYQALGIVSDGLTASANTVQSGKRSPDRVSGAQVLVNTSSSGDIETELTEENLDFFFESAFANTFDTVSDPAEDILTLGQNFQYFTVCKRYPYIPPDPNFVVGQTGEFEVYQDCQVSSLSLSMQNGQIIGVTIGVGAGALTFPLAAPYSAVTPEPAKASLVTCSSLLDVLINGQRANSIITSVSFNLDNNTTELFDVRDCASVGVSIGAADVSGEVEALHDAESSQWFQQALSNTSGSLEFQIQGETRTYRVVVPTLSTTAGSPDGSGDGDVTASFPYSAFSTSPIIYRSK